MNAGIKRAIRQELRHGVESRKVRIKKTGEVFVTGKANGLTYGGWHPFGTLKDWEVRLSQR